MCKSYKDYKIYVENLMNGSFIEYKTAIDKVLVVEREVNMNGEPYRFLNESEYKNKFKNEKK